MYYSGKWLISSFKSVTCYTGTHSITFMFSRLLWTPPPAKYIFFILLGSFREGNQVDGLLGLACGFLAYISR